MSRCRSRQAIAAVGRMCKAEAAPYRIVFDDRKRRNRVSADRIRDA